MKIKTITNLVFKRCPKSGKIVGIRNDIPAKKILFPIIGIIAIIWFLIRVLPKPSRITYPCQQLASGIGVSFLIYLATFLSTFPVFKLLHKYVHRNIAYLFIFLFIGGSIVSVGLAFNSKSDASLPGFSPNEGANAPMGIAKGIYPGRVSWVRDTTSTTWDGKSGFWWDDTNTNQKVVNAMFSEMIQSYTGKTNDKESWDALFRYYNNSHNRGNKTYKKGEKFVIKINCNHDKTSYTWDNEAHPSPAVINSVVAQLVEVVGVPGNDIIVAEPSQLIGNPIYDKIRANSNPEFKKVWFADKLLEKAAQRFYPEPDTTSGVYFTIPPTNKVVRYYLPKCYREATYIINLAIMRGHRAFGVTMGSKNHFGSIYCLDLQKYVPGKSGSNIGNRPSNNPLLHNFSMWDYEVSNKSGQPHCSPIILSHKDLGGKELVHILDGIYPTQTNEKNVVRWKSLDNHWCSSLLMSQDPIAIQSVGLDLLCNEPNVTKDNPSFTPDLDNFLHESALANNPPSGMKYDPENNGKYVSQSLGVHEHWNNPNEKKYSRNLGSGRGIELIYLNGKSN